MGKVPNKITNADQNKNNPVTVKKELNEHKMHNSDHTYKQRLGDAMKIKNRWLDRTSEGPGLQVHADSMLRDHGGFI